MGSERAIKFLDICSNKVNDTTVEAGCQEILELTF